MRPSLFMALCLSKLFFTQVIITDDSTQSYYAEFIVDEGIVSNITDVLMSLNATNITVGSDSITLENFNVTTVCEIRGNKTTCNCAPNFIWDGSVCDSNPECCNKYSCTFQTSDFIPMCAPQSRVIISGSISFASGYDSCLTNANCDEGIKLQTALQASFSTLSGFDMLVINSFRSGSVIVDFSVIVNAPFTTSQLQSKVNSLANLQGNITVNTTGLVHITTPNNPQCYNSTQNLTCVLSDPSVPGPCEWILNTGNNDFTVVNGSEVTVYAPCQLYLPHATSIWKGNYTCSYQSNTIVHTATIMLDIALLPENIETISIPQYPDCTSAAVTLSTVSCTIKISSENYTVTWVANNAKTTTSTSSLSTGYITYQVTATVTCSTRADPNVTCVFTNRKNQTQSATTSILPIWSDSITCQQDLPWPKARNNTIAMLACDLGKVGIKTRPCVNSIYGLELSPCVNMDLHNIYQDALNLQKGRGTLTDIASNIFERLQDSTNNSLLINSYANLNVSVNVISVVTEISNSTTQTPLNQTVLPSLLKSASNLLNESLMPSWNATIINQNNSFLSVKYMESVEDLVKLIHINQSLQHIYDNIEFKSYNSSGSSNIFNSTVLLSAQTATKTLGFKFLADILPNNMNGTHSINSDVLSVTVENSSLIDNIKMNIQLLQNRPRNFEISCVFWDRTTNTWSNEGCTWTNENIDSLSFCTCNHLTSFATLMSKNPVVLPYLDQITYVGLGVSICSLMICIIIEFLVWRSVVKSNISHFRHTALVNISFCLLTASCSFLVASLVEGSGKTKMCPILVVLQHFFYLAMFCWMLCLSLMLLHKLIFIFHQLRKKTYLTFSVFVGYICPAAIVTITYIYYSNGAQGIYYNADSCWLIYTAPMQGSIHAFLFPVGVIVFINLFSMLVVITKLLRPTVSESSTFDEKEVAKSILKAVVFLTPVFGVTWILGFLVLFVDFTNTTLAYFVNYSFTIINSFQGFLILLTGCFGEKTTREALLSHVSSKTKQNKTDSSKRFGSSTKK